MYIYRWVISFLFVCVQLLLEHQEALGPSPSDPLRLILAELGGVPSLEELLGKYPSLPQPYLLPTLLILP